MTQHNYSELGKELLNQQFTQIYQRIEANDEEALFTLSVRIGRLIQNHYKGGFHHKTSADRLRQMRGLLQNNGISPSFVELFDKKAKAYATTLIREERSQEEAAVKPSQKAASEEDRKMAQMALASILGTRLEKASRSKEYAEILNLCSQISENCREGNYEAADKHSEALESLFLMTNFSSSKEAKKIRRWISKEINEKKAPPAPTITTEPAPPKKAEEAIKPTTKQTEPEPDPSAKIPEEQPEKRKAKPRIVTKKPRVVQTLDLQIMQGDELFWRMADQLNNHRTLFEAIIGYASRNTSPEEKKTGCKLKEQIALAGYEEQSVEIINKLTNFVEANGVLNLMEKPANLSRPDTAQTHRNRLDKNPENKLLELNSGDLYKTLIAKGGEIAHQTWLLADRKKDNFNTLGAHGYKDWKFRIAMDSLGLSKQEIATCKDKLTSFSRKEAENLGEKPKDPRSSSSSTLQEDASPQTVYHFLQNQAEMIKWATNYIAKNYINENGEYEEPPRRSVQTDNKRFRKLLKESLPDCDKDTAKEILQKLIDYTKENTSKLSMQQSRGRAL